MIQSSISISLFLVLSKASITTCRPIVDSSDITYRLLETTSSPLPEFDLLPDTSSSSRQPQQSQPDSRHLLDLLPEPPPPHLATLDDPNLNPNFSSSFNLFPNPTDPDPDPDLFQQLADSESEEEEKPETERLCPGKNRFAFCCDIHPLRSGCVFTVDCTREEALNCCTADPDLHENYRDCQPVSSPPGGGGGGNMIPPLGVDDVSSDLFDGQAALFSNYDDQQQET